MSAQDFQAGHRAGRLDGLLEAIVAARSESLHDNTGTPEDEAYNQGVRDAVTAIEELVKGAQAVPQQRGEAR